MNTASKRARNRLAQIRRLRTDREAVQGHRVLRGAGGNCEASRHRILDPHRDILVGSRRVGAKVLRVNLEATRRRSTVTDRVEGAVAERIGESAFGGLRGNEKGRKKGGDKGDGGEHLRLYCGPPLGGANHNPICSFSVAYYHSLKPRRKNLNKACVGLCDCPALY